MRENEFVLSEVFPARASDIYNAWLTREGHSAITGSAAEVDGRVGGKFTAWDGYISGSTLELTADQRIVQAGRMTEFPDDAPDSRLEVLFEEVAGGTKITLTHSDLPADQIDSYKQGWEDFYFKPMREYYGG
ncbi:MAG TPA: SRPBCC domain-containing protein [Anaerolineales bacterium]|nr:SRPBCC domain-containing protein [Anaerolineales bacterium]